MMDNYPLAMSNEKYARLAPPKTFQERMGRPVTAVQTLGNGIVRKEANDALLADLEDSMKRGGSLFIASLATLGAANKLIGVGEYLGFLSWFGAMAVTPKIVNGMIWLKTGINLNQEYINTQGIRQPLFKDRKYLPLHLIPDDRMQFIADRIGIPRGIPDRRRLTEEKISQISVQGRTWWMLLAGPATPVISGLICDVLQDKVAGAINFFKRFYHMNIGVFQASNDKTARGKESVVRHLDLYLDERIGETANSQLSRWWKTFGTDLTREMGLRGEFGMHEVLHPVSQEALLDKLVDTIHKMDKTAKNYNPLNNALEYLENQKAYLADMEQDLAATLKRYERSLGTLRLDAAMGKMKSRILNASVTVQHYIKLLNAAKRQAPREEIHALMEKPILGEIQKLIDMGLSEDAKKLVGSEVLYKEIRELLLQNRFTTAFNRLGAAPGQHMLEALKNGSLRKLWRFRVVGLLGGGMLLATWLYTQFVVGGNFGKNADIFAPNMKREPKPWGH